MEDKTTIDKSQPQSVSDALRQFIEELVREVALKGQPFDTQKKWLRRYAENEGVDYEELEKNITALFEASEELKSHESKSVERLVKMLGEDCYLSEEVADGVIKASGNTRKNAESVARAEAVKKQEEEKRMERMAEMNRVPLIIMSVALVLINILEIVFFKWWSVLPLIVNHVIGWIALMPCWKGEFHYKNLMIFGGILAVACFIEAWAFKVWSLLSIPITFIIVTLCFLNFED